MKCNHYWEEDHRSGFNHGGYICRKCNQTKDYNFKDVSTKK